MNIFISYAREDQKLAEQISLALRARHTAFFDTSRYYPGDEFNAAIQKDIKKCNLFIFLISPEAVSPGSYALTELRFAEEKWAHPDSRVLPVLIKPTDLELIPEFLKAVTILQPKGNIPAEVLAWVTRVNQKHLRKRVVFWVSVLILLGLGGGLMVSEYLKNVQPKAFAEIANGIVKTSCSVDPQGSGIQFFKNGWMVARYGPREGTDKEGKASTYYSIVRDDTNGTLKWKRKISGYIQPNLKKDGLNSSKCPPHIKENNIILGFSWWYCDPSFGLQKELGEPDHHEHRGWIQYQEWSKGLLLYGLPSRDFDYDKKNDDLFIGKMSAVFLYKENERESGTGEWKKISSMGFPEEYTKCSPLWHWSRTHYGKEGSTVLHNNRSQGICKNMRTIEEYIEPRPICGLY